jgi:hypothetical protein
MKKRTLLLATYLLAAVLPVLAAQIVSVNFFVLEPDSGWGFETETINNNSKAGLPGVSSVRNWNNIQGGDKGKKASGLIDSKGNATELEISFGRSFSTWNKDYNKQPNKAGVSAWPNMNLRPAIEVMNLKSISETYDVILFLGTQADSGFSSGEVTVNGESRAIDAQTENLVFEGMSGDALKINLKNTTPKGTDKPAVVIGGLQIVGR